MGYPKTFISRLCLILNYGSAISIVILTLSVCGNILARTIFHKPFGGIYEIVGLLSILVISLALGDCELNNKHLAVDLVVRKFSERTKAAIDIFTRCISIGVFSMLAWYSFGYAEELRTSGEVSQSLEISFSPFVFVVAVSSVVLCLALALGLYRSAGKVAKKNES